MDGKQGSHCHLRCHLCAEWQGTRGKWPGFWLLESRAGQPEGRPGRGTGTDCTVPHSYYVQEETGHRRAPHCPHLLGPWDAPPVDEGGQLHHRQRTHLLLPVSSCLSGRLSDF